MEMAYGHDVLAEEY